MTYIRAHRRGDHVYYEELESFRDENGVTQKRRIRWLGKDKTPPPDPIPIDGIDFADLATRLFDNTLTPDDVFTLLDRIGKRPVTPDELESIGIHFDMVQKKLTLYLCPKGYQWHVASPRAPRAKKSSSEQGRTKGPASSRSKAKAR